MFADYLVAKLSNDVNVYIGDDILMFYYVENQQKDYAYFNHTILGLPDTIYGENASPFWIYGSDANSPALLKDEVKNDLVLYLAGTTNDSTLATYNSFKTFFNRLLTDAREHFSNLATTIAAYDEYAVIVIEMMKCSSLAAGLTYLIVSVFFYIVTPLIKKDGRTLAKRMFGISVVNVDGKKVKSGQIIMRGALEIVTFSLSLVFVPFLNWGYSSFELPFLIIGDFVFSYLSFGLVSAAICIVSLIVMAFSNDVRSIHDFAARTMVYDTSMWRASLINKD